VFDVAAAGAPDAVQMMMFSILKINETEWTTWMRSMIAE
jgi:hypothetical protein